MEAKLQIARLTRTYSGGTEISNPIKPMDVKAGFISTFPVDPEKTITIQVEEDNSLFIIPSGQNGIMIPSELVEAFIYHLIQIRYDKIETEPPPFLKEKEAKK